MLFRSYLYNLAIDHSSLSDNTAGIDGGGIYNLSFFGDTGLTVRSCMLSGNTAANGGGIYNRGALLFVSNSAFANTPDNISGAYTDLGGNSFA